MHYTTLSATLVFAATTAAQGFRLDYRPTAREVILDTAFTQIQPTVGPPINVAGGIFRFRNVTIPAGVNVRGVGPNPMIWIVTGDFRVGGTLTVRGGDGQPVNTLNSANFPTGGGIAGCGGGSGGQGSPETQSRSVSGQNGFGPNQVPMGPTAGGGGLLACIPGCNRGSGGGGGSFASIGDPWYTAGLVTQSSGAGGVGCVTPFLPGGPAGGLAFQDANEGNNFWGVGYDLNQGRPVLGELAAPRGGSGGGGGGDNSNSCAINDPLFINDEQGGGGGAGGGILVVFALGRVIIEQGGTMDADGGNGGGGEPAGSNLQGGGGGGGSGGMLIVFGQQSIDVHVNGETYLNGDYDFSLSADGGIGAGSAFNGASLLSKYPPPANAVDIGAAGGFGGLGLVQLYCRPGTNTDGTNTVLDDGIRIFVGGNEVQGTEKQRFLGWRGYPNQLGVWVDDFGNPTQAGNAAGDIYPQPILLPIL